MIHQNIRMDNNPSSVLHTTSIPVSFLHVIEAIVSSARNHQSPTMNRRSVPLKESSEEVSGSVHNDTTLQCSASKDTPTRLSPPESSSHTHSPSSIATPGVQHTTTPGRSSTSPSYNAVPPSSAKPLQPQTPGTNANQHRMCYTDDTSDESESEALQHAPRHRANNEMSHAGVATPHESSLHHLEAHHLPSSQEDTFASPRKLVLDDSPNGASDVVGEQDDDFEFPVDNIDDGFDDAKGATTPKKVGLEPAENDDFEFPVEDDADKSFGPPIETGTKPKKEVGPAIDDGDFEFPVDEYEDGAFGPLIEVKGRTPKKEVAEEHHQRSESKKHRKKKKSKKSKKHKKKHKSGSKRSRDDSSSADRRHSKRHGASSEEKVKYAKITPELERRKSEIQVSDGDGFYDPRVKPYKPGRTRAVDASKNVVNCEPAVMVPPTQATVVERTPTQRSREDQTQYTQHRPRESLPTKETPRSKLTTPVEDDGLEIPYESPEPPSKRKRIPEAPATQTSKRKRTQCEERTHVLCSESFIESSSQAAASLACGSWLGNARSTSSAHQAHSISLHDSALLDEMGVDVEIAGKGAILVQRVSTWGQEQDLKVLIRELVKLTALGRYHTILVILVVDIVITPSLARDIAFVQGTPLGNTDCIVTFQMVAESTALAAAIAQRVLRASAKFSDECLTTSMFDALLPDYYPQIAFLLQIASSFTATGALQLLWDEEKTEPCVLKDVFADVDGTSVAARQLRLAALAGLNPGLEREI